MADRTRKRSKSASGGSAMGAKPILIGVTAFLIAAIAATAVFTATSGGEDSSSGSFTPNDEGLIQPGEQAPQASAEALDGGEVSLPGSGETTLLAFFATWCPHCNNDAPIFAELAQENENLNVVMAGIDGEDNAQKVEEFADEYDIEGQAFYEPSIGQTYQVSGYPTTYVIDGSGEIVGANTGETPKDVLQGWIDQAGDN